MSFGGLSIALSLVFGCLLLALCAQLYYFLWWKKKRTQMDIEMDAKGVFYWGCWKTTPCAMMHGGNNTGRGGVNSRDMESTTASHHEPEMELDLLHKSFGEEGTVESELMRLHNLAGPPRFLFPIKEESKEDLESEDRSRKGSRTRSLSDLMLTIDTPFLTPVASSPLKCCSLPADPLHSYKHQGFNPLFESSTELDYNRFRSSPPPKFKFMRDAEEKLHRKLMEEAARRKAVDNVQECCGVIKDSCSNETLATDFSDGSFLKFIQNNKDTTTERKQLQQYLPQFPSGSSQILPLASSPTTFRPLEKASIVH